jgi:predicted 2-oxoglutarate/Fe(II)-dependent dioxygenase YbiX
MTSYKIEQLDLTKLFPYKTNPYAMVIKNVLTKEECINFINLTEKKGYTKALVSEAQILDERFRKHERCMIDDITITNDIFNKIKDYLPVSWNNYPLLELNERLRFLKYHPGNYFKPHNDGNYKSIDGLSKSFITIQIYLNDLNDDQGGQTTFTTEIPGYGRHAFKTQNNEIKTLGVIPKAGDILVFEQHLLHEGSILNYGVKYTCRTDVMYLLEKIKK